MERIFLFAFLLFTLISKGQGEYSGGSAGSFGFNNSNIGRVVNLADLQGNSFLKKYEPTIKGSPFLNNNWAAAKVKLSKGKEINPLNVKLNLESNELYFIDSTGKEMIAMNGIVKRIDFLDLYTNDSIRYVFKNGYPSIDDQNLNFYYQVYAEGKLELIGKKTKYISTTKDGFSGEISKDFTDGINVLYVVKNNSIQELQYKKSFITSLMNDKEKEINEFIEVNKINLKKKTDLIKLFNYYNSL